MSTCRSVLILSVVFLLASAKFKVKFDREWKNCDEMPCSKGFKCEMRDYGKGIGPICAKIESVDTDSVEISANQVKSNRMGNPGCDTGTDTSTSEQNSQWFEQCNALLCSPDQVCQVEGGIMSCVPHNTDSKCNCRSEQLCVLQVVQCFTTPCYPIPNCVSSDSYSAATTVATSKPPLGACNLFCIKGLVCEITSSGPTCVPEEHTDTETTDTECGENQFLNSCGNHCDPDCHDAITGEPKICTLICNPPACSCQPGFYRENPGGNCITKEQCQNDEFPPDIVATCASTLCLVGTDCVETPTGAQCVPRPLECGELEQVGQCGNLCEPECEQALSGEGKVCIEICNPPACICKDGLFREKKSGKCLTKIECEKPDFSPIAPVATCAVTLCIEGTDCIETENGAKCVPRVQLECGEDEQVNQCGNLCEPGCKNAISGEGRICIKICNPPACVCKDGLFRDEKTGKCLSEDQCKLDGPSSDSTCASTTCSVGLVCVETPFGAQCVLQGNENTGNDGYATPPTDVTDSTTVPTLTCANALCSPDSGPCIETPEGPFCPPKTTTPESYDSVPTTTAVTATEDIDCETAYRS